MSGDSWRGGGRGGDSPGRIEGYHVSYYAINVSAKKSSESTPCLTSLSLCHSSLPQQLNKLASEVLLLLARHPDTLVVMAAENILPVLLAMREKFVYEAKVISLKL